MRRSLLVLAILAFAVPALAQQPGTDQKAQTPHKLSAEEAAMMAAWEKAATPGPEHRRLATLAGSWTFTSRYYPGPGAPPQESKGTATSEMIFGGRYLLDNASGEAMGMPFEGMGLTAYDNVKRAYVSTWIDSMSTGMLVSEGRWDEATASLVFEGEYADPVTGKPKKMKMVTKVPSAERHTTEFWEAGPDGTPFKNMEIEFVRR